MGVNDRGPVESERFALARAASDAALNVPGVLETVSGPDRRWVTVDHGQRLPGVICVASAGGGYDVSLWLKCELTPLSPLGTTVAGAVRGAAARHGYQIDELRIEIADVADPLEQHSPELRCSR